MEDNPKQRFLRGEKFMIDDDEYHYEFGRGLNDGNGIMALANIHLKKVTFKAVWLDKTVCSTFFYYNLYFVKASEKIV